VQRRERLLRPGQRVVDLGCWPGGWLQVAARAVGETGRVVGVDRTPLEPGLEAPGVVVLELDLAAPDAAARIRAALGGPADVLLSDAAPKLTGVRATDRAREEALLEAIEVLVAELLRPGGDLLLKLLESPEARAAAQRIARGFERSRTLRTAASRKGSSESYLLARGALLSGRGGRE
jgi:23S rRNA (uridine2552-2'-O)-methyltransferase